MKIATCAIVALLYVGAAQSQETRADSGGYMGFSVGSLNYEEDLSSLGLNKFSDSALSYKAVGGYRFSEFFALEGGIGRTSNLENGFSIGGINGTLSANYELTTLRALGMIPVGTAKLVGGVGYYDTTVNVKISAVGFGSASDSSDDDGATVIGGVQFDLDRVSIRAEYEWFNTEDSVDASDISMSVLFRF